MAAQLDKIFQCLTCKQDIRLARNEDNSGWMKYNLGGSLHVHERKNKKQQQPQQQEQQSQPVVTAVDNNGPQIAVLAEQVKDLKDTVNILISQIQMLRSEVKNNRK